MTKLGLAVFVFIFMAALPVVAQENTADDPKRKEAMNLMTAGKYPEAAKIYEKIVEASPLSAPDHYMYGETLYYQGKYMEAALEMKQAHNIKPSESQYALRCAEAYLAAGKKDEATSLCDVAASQAKDPFYAQALGSLKNQILHPYVPAPVNDPERPKQNAKSAEAGRR